MLLLLLSCFSHVRLCATPQTAAHQASLSPGFSRQEQWSGLPFPSPMHESKSEGEVTQSCLTLRNPKDCSLPGSSIHGIFQARVLEWGAIAFSEIVQQTNFISLVASLSATSPFSETFQSQNIEVSLTVSTDLSFTPFQLFKKPHICQFLLTTTAELSFLSWLYA